MQDLESFIKPEFHQLLQKDDDIWILMNPDFEKRLNQYLRVYKTINKKEGKHNLANQGFAKLPYNQNSFEWKFRQHSFEITEQILRQKRNQNILEIGSYNGWLSNRLAEKNTVIAVDHFLDETYGLKSKKHYKNSWHSIQTDIMDLNFLSGNFDYIILNHALQFCERPIAYVQYLLNFLKKDGALIILGLSFYKDSSKKIQEVSDFKKHYKDDYNFEIFLNPTKAFLDFNDRNQLNKIGVEITPYPQFWLRNIYAKINPLKPFYCYGIYQSKNSK